MNRSLNELVDYFKEHDSFKVRGRSARREHVIQLALLDILNQEPEKIASRLAAHIPNLESTCD